MAAKTEESGPLAMSPDWEGDGAVVEVVCR